MIEVTGRLLKLHGVTCGKGIRGESRRQPRHTKTLPAQDGLQERQWLPKLLAGGCSTQSFRPAEEIRVWRSYPRHRGDFASAQAQGSDGEEQRKTQLENAISDRSGTTGMKTLQDIVRGSARSDMTSTWSGWPGATAAPRAGAAEPGPQRGVHGGGRKHEAAAVRAAGVVS